MSIFYFCLQCGRKCRLSHEHVQLTKQDLFNIIGIKQDLEEMHMPVDVVSYRLNMNPFLKRC